MRDVLAATERRFETMRLAPADPMAACAEALAAVEAAEPANLAAARAIAATLAETRDELPYHNRHHFAEAALAMGWLCRIALAEDRLDRSDAAAGVLAMLGHDIDHDGSAVHDGRLEAVSARRIAAIGAAAGLAAPILARIGDVILATNPALVAGNAAAGATPEGLLRRLANEADVFASLLPRLGRRLGDALAAERHLPKERPYYQERLAFLRVYPAFSPPACASGLAALQADQVAAFARVGAGDPQTGARRLDQMPAPAARAKYNRFLRAKHQIE